MAENGIERRFFDCEVRMAGDGEQRRIVGHGAVFEQLSENLGGFREMIMPGAFADTIGTDDVRSLFNHDPNMILGRNRSGTLRLAEDGTGLKYEVDSPDTSYARDLEVSVDRGDVTQGSFGFVATEESWIAPGELDPNLPVRKLIKVRLYDVGPVTFPAYPTTDVSVRALDKARELGKEFSKEQTPDGRATGGDETGAARRALLRRRLDLAERLGQ